LLIFLLNVKSINDSVKIFTISLMDFTRNEEFLELDEFIGKVSLVISNSRTDIGKVDLKCILVRNTNNFL
jgi:hypothetical protein